MKKKEFITISEIAEKLENEAFFNEGDGWHSVPGTQTIHQYGFIDVNGEVVIEAQFDNVSAFNNGVAVAVKGNDAFLIDKQGKKIKGTEKIPISNYFVENGVAYSPSTYFLIKEDSKYGFGKLQFK